MQVRRWPIDRHIKEITEKSVHLKNAKKIHLICMNKRIFSDLLSNTLLETAKGESGVDKMSCIG